LRACHTVNAEHAQHAEKSFTTEDTEEHRGRKPTAKDADAEERARFDAAPRSGDYRAERIRRCESHEAN